MMSMATDRVCVPSEEDLMTRTYVSCRELPLKLVDTRPESRAWKCLSLFLALLCICLTATVTVGGIWLRMNLDQIGQIKDNNNNNDNNSKDTIGCEDPVKGPNRNSLIQATESPFRELSSEEIDAAVRYLHQQDFLQLAHHDQAGINSNYIHLVEMLMPPKDEVLRFLNGSGPRPQRMARAFIFRGNTSQTAVEEYVVGPLPNPTYANLITTEARKTRVPFNLRPFSKYEFKAIYQHVLPTVLKKASHILKESYDAGMKDCGKKCLRFTNTPISSGFLEAGKRKAWFWFTYDLEFFTLHPLDFQFLVDNSDSDPKNWKVERVFYANALYESLDDLVEKYREGNINKTRIPFPPISDEDRFSSVNIRGDPVPRRSLPPPEQLQPMGPRYRLNGNVLEYMDWKFHIRVSPTVGTQLYNIEYRNERIVYELSMQEIAVSYSGHSPAASMLYFADSAGLFGTRMRGMMPGVDCPDHGTMFDTLSYTSLSKGKLTSQNSLCIFEHDTGTLLRRHRAYSMSGAFYSGLKDYALVVRMYICIINYDYIFDFVFHNNGAIEVKVSSTGYLATSFYYPQEEQYGTRITENVVAGLHHHLFHFKADIDVKGTDNRVQTLNIESETKTNTWAEDPSRQHVQNVITKTEKKTEKEASSPVDFNQPKYLLIYKNKKSELGHTPAYRIINKGMTKTQLPKDLGFEPSITWAHHQVAMTKFKDDEMTSSSMFAMWDAQDPVVRFDKYLEDDESLEDEDVVAWLTVGMYHIPQLENAPNTATVGTTQSFFLTPYNYFPEDPSLASRDGVKVEPKDPNNTNGGASVNRHNMTFYFDCRTKQIDESIDNDSTFLFL